MARKKVDFRPDPAGTGILSKLYITKGQRRMLLKWGLHSLMCIAVLVVQDVILSRVEIFGGMIDLTPAVILLVCVMEGAQNGGVFALAAATFYHLSGSAPGPYCIFVLTVLGVLAAIFRQNFLYHNFAPRWLCTAAAVAVYQLSVFGMGLFLTQTHLGRFPVFAMNAVLATVCLLPVYPVFQAINRIGGDTWKE